MICIRPYNSGAECAGRVDILVYPYRAVYKNVTRQNIAA
mgnify:CR=1 FL=1